MAVAAVLGVAGPASAATVRLDVQAVAAQGVARVVYDAAPGERNQVEVSDTAPTGAPSDPVGDYWVQDSGAAMTPGNGCAPTAVFDFEGAPVFIRCPIPAGARPGGAVVYLRDRDDVARIDIVGGETQVFASSGDDQLVGRGALSGGPGTDSLQGSGELQGGPGWDTLTGSGRLDGGRGDDHVTGSGRLIGGPGRDELRGNADRDIIDARDGSIDFVRCGNGSDTAVLDGLDTYLLDRPYDAYWDWKQPPPGECEHLRRRGAARAVPISIWGDADSDGLGEYDWGVDVGCPPDGPSICIGDVTVWRSGRHVIGRDHFRIRRGRADYGGYWAHPRSALVRRLQEARVWVRVRSFDRRGRLRLASGPFTGKVNFPPYPY